MTQSNQDASRPKSPYTSIVATAHRDFQCGFYSDGRLALQKGTKNMVLAREDAERLIDFLDSINIDRIVEKQ